MSDEEQASVLRSEGWTVLLRGRPLLQDVDFDVKACSCFTVMGDSGSGKSLLLRMLSGSMAKYPGIEQSGLLSYLGEPLSQSTAPPMVSMSAGLLLASVFDALLERVRFTQNYSRLEWTAWLEVRLQRWGFPDLLGLLDAQVISLSPLHQRVVAIAREALGEPPLVLIDELTRELEEYDRFVLLDFVRELSSEMAVMVAVSNPKEARVLRGEMIYLAQGHVTASGNLLAFLDDESFESSSVMDVEVPEDLRDSRPVDLRISTMLEPEVQQPSEGAWEGVLPLLKNQPEALHVPPPAAGPMHLTEHVPSSFGPRGFYWIMPGKLAGMPLPGLLNGLDHDLSALRRCRITTLVSLSQQPVNAQALLHHKLEALNLPGGNKDIPSLAQLRMVVRAIERVLKQDGSVAVHCVSGNTRTGMVLAAYLVHQGVAPEAAVEQVKASNSLFNLQEQHLDVLRELSQSVRKAKA